MGYKHSREEILEAAVEVVTDDGLGLLSFGRVAKRLGTNDRTIVYYFPTKDDLVLAVLAALGDQLQSVLAEALPTTARDHREVVAAAWPVVASDEAEPTFRLYFELAGLAAAGRPPYADLAGAQVQGWIDWVAGLLVGDADTRRREAEAAVAALDGLLLVRVLAGPDIAGSAAAGLGFVE